MKRLLANNGVFLVITQRELDKRIGCFNESNWNI